MGSPVIDKERLHNVCKIGQGPETCRYVTGSAEG
jgi:hypothetical protein